MKFAVLTKYDTWITTAESIADACEQFDWKYPGTVLAVMQLEDSEETCPFCGAKMDGGKVDG